MANLPSRHPDLAIHLTDRALTPLISSARAQQHFDSLTTLSHTALSAHESAHRLGLGPPQRIIVEHGEGPVLLQAFLSPRAPAATPTPTATAVTTPLLTQDDQSLPPFASLSISAPAANGGASQSPPSPAPKNPRQHQGALALAAESRGATVAAAPTTATTTTTTTAYLRGGAAPNHDVDHHRYNDNHLGYGHHPLLLADDADLDEDENPDAPPMLVGIVVAASSDDTLEARRAAARLEQVGREIQGQWSEMQGQGQSPTPRQEDAAAD